MGFSRRFDQSGRDSYRVRTGASASKPRKPTCGTSRRTRRSNLATGDAIPVLPEIVAQAKAELGLQVEFTLGAAKGAVPCTAAFSWYLLPSKSLKRSPLLRWSIDLRTGTQRFSVPSLRTIGMEWCLLPGGMPNNWERHFPTRILSRCPDDRLRSPVSRFHCESLLGMAGRHSSDRPPSRFVRSRLG